MKRFLGFSLMLGVILGLAAWPVFALQGGSFNLNGEFNLRYRHNNSSAGGTPGFQFYETELFFDTQVNDNVGLFLELPFMHQNKPDIGNAWVDFHSEGELAATENTGVMLGNLMPFFGYYGYDDNQSYIFGGRTTTNTALVRNFAIDGMVIRSRQIGVVGNYKIGQTLLQGQLYNGNGMFIQAGGSDNDRTLDAVLRIQQTLPSEIGLLGAGYWNAPKTTGAVANVAGANYAGTGFAHARDILRYAVFFKYPNVQQATLPDLSLGGKPFMIYGEYVWGVHKGNAAAVGLTTDQNFSGYWVETNVNVIRDKVVGVLRFDYMNPNTSDSEAYLIGITPAIKWEVLKQTFLTLNAEYYDGGSTASASTKASDRITAELAIQF